MGTISIDTRLTASGYSQQQAEAQAEIWSEVVEENLVTKTDLAKTQAVLETDLAKVQAKLETELAKLHAELKADMRELEYRLTIKLGGMLVVGITILTALQKIVH